MPLSNFLTVLLWSICSKFSGTRSRWQLQNTAFFRSGKLANQYADSRDYVACGGNRAVGVRVEGAPRHRLGYAKSKLCVKLAYLLGVPFAFYFAVFAEIL